MNSLKYLLICCLYPLLLLSCDKEEEMKDTSYVDFTITFVNVENPKSYKIFFNGKEVKDGHVLSKENEPGLLEVFKTGSANPKLNTDIVAKKNSNIRIIELADDKFDIYDEKKYYPFDVSILYMEGQSNLYEAKFNGMPLQNNGTNYCNIENSKGVLQIFKKGENVPSFTSNEISLSPNYKVNILQLSNKDFLLNPKDSEPNPPSKQYSKVRIFYTSSALPNVEAIKLIIYAFPGISMSEFKPIATIDELKVGEFSNYFTIDWDYYAPTEPVAFCYDIINIKTGEKIIDYNVDVNTALQLTEGYAKQTCMITSKAQTIITVNELSTPW